MPPNFAHFSVKMLENSEFRKKIEKIILKKGTYNYYRKIQQVGGWSRIKMFYEGMYVHGDREKIYGTLQRIL